MSVIQVWKQIGETPLQALLRAKLEYNIPADVKGCYTGRLDPMAHGTMTLLFGDQVHRSEEFNALSKIYLFQAILGISTASYDPLGRIQNIRQVTASEAEQFVLKVQEHSGKLNLEQQLPPCSAYRYHGKPLWKHAADGTLPNPLPTKKVKIYDICVLQPHPTAVGLNSYREDVLDDIGDVMHLNPNAVFDYNGIIGDWQDLHEGQPLNHVYRICLKATVGSGTFIRSLVYDTAKELGIPAHAFRITRTQTF